MRQRSAIRSTDRPSRSWPGSSPQQRTWRTGKLSLEALHKTYGGDEVLRGLNLAVDDDSLTVVVGPSGCGKTTSLRIAAGLEAPTSGVVRLSGTDVTRTRPADRNIGMVFQVPALLPYLSVEDNVGFGLRVRHIRGATARAKVAEALELVGIPDLAKRRPAGLSGGEAQLVALARATVREPDVFLLDEPLSSLDALVRAAMRSQVRQVQRATGRAMLYVTHDQVEAMTLADRLAVLRDGVISQYGTPSEIYEQPADTFVARFIGSPSMTILPATRDADGLVAGPFSVPLMSLEPGGDDAELEVGVRPEHVEVVAHRGGGTAAGNVDVVETLGSEAILTVRCSGVSVLARVPASLRSKAGDQVGIVSTPSVWHVFRDGIRVGGGGIGTDTPA